MFGSNFDQQFGIPAFPFEGMDPQGGLFGTNVTPPAGDAGQTSAAAAGPALNLPSPAAIGGQGNGPPAAGLPDKNMANPALGAPSALGGGLLAPGAGQGASAGLGAMDATQGQAPAAGLGSPFGKANV